MDRVYSVQSEWDIGLEGVMFSTRGAAEAEARESLVACGIDYDYADLVEGGLVYVRTHEVR